MKTLSTQEVAETLGVSRKLVLREIRLGHLTAFRPGLRAWRVTADSLSAYVERKEQQARDSVVWQ